MQSDGEDDKYSIDVVSLESVYLMALQSGFRKNRNAVDVLIQFEEDIQTAIANKNHTDVTFIDINKAYDTAWRRGVAQILYCLRGNMPMFVDNFFFLKGRSWSE